MLTTLFRLNRRFARGLIVAAVIVVLATGGLPGIHWARMLTIVGILALAGSAVGLVMRLVVPLRTRMRALEFLDSGKRSRWLREHRDVDREEDAPDTRA